MQIDPRMVKQLLEYQMMNSIDLSGTSLDGAQNSTDSFFSEMLEQLMNGGGSTDSSDLATSLLNTSLDTSSSASSLGLDSGNSQLWYNLLAQTQTAAYADPVDSTYTTAASAAAGLSSSAMAELESASGSGSQGASTPYDAMIAEASQKYGVPEALIKAVIDTESSFKPNVESSAGAKGLMQLMDGTARGLGVSNPFDPAQNIDGGARYLSYQLKRYGGEIKMALAAYNAGPSKVNALGVSSDNELTQKLDQLPAETRNYIEKIERAMTKYV
ncbi:lytic transglycosylase domain-containing protein [Paenibacillus pinistramenti]|uniref:lytic transglycosylase domain-containing protein n=1 Tax=Paenibacillus pinistramenti TaxID=1768003 RepID=UPI001107F914|nr:lytic transglycosylase domain-containing protein [Paenibacillus pinistramenti]